MARDASVRAADGRPRRRSLRITIRFALALVAVAALLLGAQRHHQDWKKRQNFFVRAYVVADLIPRGDTPSARPLVLPIKPEKDSASSEPWPWAIESDPASFEPLMRRIKTEIEEESWSDNGGEGTIQPFYLNRSLIVRNHQLAHEGVVRLLRQLRQEQEGPAEAEEVRPPKPVAATGPPRRVN